MRNQKRGFIEISFAWLFAIIAGVVILAIAIFLATRVINLGQTATSAQTQNQIAVLLNPLETSFEPGQIISIRISTPTRIYNQCDDRNGIFGNQIISSSQKSFGKWSTPTSGAAFQNKYIFSSSIVEGQLFYLFSKPFNLPFKVSDIIYMTSSDTNYCFVNPPPSIQDELSKLKEKNIVISNETGLCGGIKVCFEEQGCYVNVDYTQGIVSKGSNSSVNFRGDALMYAAIFSDKNIYECQLKRLMEREAQLSSLYIDKANTIGQIGCSSSLIPDLTQLNSLSNSFKNSGELDNLLSLANKIEQENEQICKI